MKTQERNSFVVNLAQVLSDVAFERDAMGEEQLKAKERVQEIELEIYNLGKSHAKTYKQRDDLYRNELEKKDEQYKEINNDALQLSCSVQNLKKEKQSFEQQIKNGQEQNDNQTDTIIGLRKKIDELQEAASNQPEQVIKKATPAQEALREIKATLPSKYYNNTDPYYSKYRGPFDENNKKKMFGTSQKTLIKIAILLEGAGL